MKQSTQNFIIKNSKKFVNISSPAGQVGKQQITDVAVIDEQLQYSTNNGETYVPVPIPDSTKIANYGQDGLSPYQLEDYTFKVRFTNQITKTVSLSLFGSNTSLTVFWGDGELTESSPFNHTYAMAGTYVITIKVNDMRGVIYLNGFSTSGTLLDFKIMPQITNISYTRIPLTGTLIIPPTVTYLGENGLSESSYSRIEIQNKLQILDAFSGMRNLTEVIGFENCYADNMIYNAAAIQVFRNCTSLKKIAVSRGFNRLRGTFEGCSSLESVFIPDTITTITSGDLPFKNANSSAVVYCEADSKPVGWDDSWNNTTNGTLTVKWGYTKEQYEIETGGGFLQDDVLNAKSSSQKQVYSADFVNKNFVPLSFASRIYAKKTSATTATLEDSKPTLDNMNYLTVTTTNTDFDWNNPQFTLTRTIATDITLNATNSFAVDLYFSLSHARTVAFGAKIKASTDNGSTWETISTNQSFAEKTYTTALNGEDFVVYTDALATETTYQAGTLLKIEIFTKQANNSSLTTDYYCGVDIDGAGVYSFVEFNFANVNINTEQIEDGAVTKPKLSQSLQNEIDGKQDALVSGTNIKTIEGQSVLGSGNLDIKTYKTFPVDWVTDGSIVTLMQDIENDISAVPGNAYLGEVTCVDLPFNGNAELVIEIMDGTVTEKTIVATLTSGNVAPYFWKYTFWVTGGIEHTSGWQAFLPNRPIDNAPTADSTNLVTSGGVATALAGKQDTLSLATQSTPGLVYMWQDANGIHIWNTVPVVARPLATVNNEVLETADGFELAVSE